MSYKKYLLLSAFITGLLPAPPLLLAHPVTYEPGAWPTPLFQGEKELHVGMMTGTGGFTLPFSYSLDNQYAIAGGFSFQSTTWTEHIKNSSQSFDLLITGYDFEAGPGFYFPFGENIGTEVLPMFGAGQTSATPIDHLYCNKNFPCSSDEISAQYTKLLIQSNIGFTHKLVDVGAAFRLTGFYTLGTRKELEIAEGKETDIDGTSVIIEPLLFVRLGYRTVKLEFQVGLSEPLFKSKGVGVEELQGSFGLHFTFGKK